MNKFEKILSKWNFKKIAIIYIVVSLIIEIGCASAIGIIYKDRLSFAYQYSKIESSLKKNDSKLLSNAIDKTATGTDVIDILKLDKNNNILYSAKKSKFYVSPFNLTKEKDEKKYLVSSSFSDSIFKYVKNDEFLLNSIINKDFGKIKEDYDDDVFFENDNSSKTIYMLSCIRSKKSAEKVYVISLPTAVQGGMLALKITAAVTMLLFAIYWVLIALWLYKDAAKSKLSPLYWGLIGLFTNLIGLIVYKIYKRNTITCSDCGAAQSTNHLFCSYCGAKLGIQCKNCGSNISAKDSFCHHCGNKIK